MNKVILKGNVGKDPEVKKFDWGKVAKFSLATTESYKNKEGEKVTNTEWHNCVFKGTIAEVIEKYVHKGDQLLVEGKNVTRQYESNGVNHWATEVVCHSFEFCGTKEKVESKSDNKTNANISDINDLPGNVDDGSIPGETPPPF